MDLHRLFSDLADSEDDLLIEGPTVVFTRHGQEHALELSHLPGIGPSLRRDGQPMAWQSVPTFIQNDILQLPVLAKQIAKALNRKHHLQGIVGFVDGPICLVKDNEEEHRPHARSTLQELLNQQVEGTTQILQLMAPAGQGKTLLLEHLALAGATEYRPEPYPCPLLLVVDLLGRYVGTIHDAIAGSLSNTYKFPGLTGRDVALCIRQRWLNLALDGFDELVARVGTREAFLRTKELLDELQRSGTVVLSARETFFALFEIASSLRAYLQPQKGSYRIWSISLSPWTDEQGEGLLRTIGSPNPAADLRGLLDAFGDDRDLVLRPFFLSRLAHAWLGGERFPHQSGNSLLDRVDYVVGVFLDREATQKWRNRDSGEPLLSTSGHTHLLASIAEEMWRSGSFILTTDEVDIAGRLALSEQELPPFLIEDLAVRVPTHALLVSSGRGVRFVHESLFLYFLGSRIGRGMASKDWTSVSAILHAGELGPVAVQWAAWYMAKGKHSLSEAATWLLRSYDTRDSGTGANLARLIGGLAALSTINNLAISGLQILGDAFVDAKLMRVTFTDCEFWNADLANASLELCIFERCRIGNVRVGSAGSLRGCEFRYCELGALEMTDGETLFSPEDIRSYLAGLDCSVLAEPAQADEVVDRKRALPKDVIRIVDKFRRAKTWDLCKEESIERYGVRAGLVVDVGMETGVFRGTARDTSGARKELFRFAVDRERLFSAQSSRIGEEKIDAFWDELEARTE